MNEHSNRALSQADIIQIIGATILSTSASVMEMLEKLYVELRVGGGFLSGRKMSEELAKQTRWEVVPYATALLTVMLDGWSQRLSDDLLSDDDAKPILAALEKAVSSFVSPKARAIMRLIVSASIMWNQPIPKSSPVKVLFMSGSCRNSSPSGRFPR